ncbi:MAG: hypothetical protein HN548_05370 [Opitutae bacterium]|nr:hypothetical protein [Opitutae bacterium]
MNFKYFLVYFYSLLLAHGETQTIEVSSTSSPTNGGAISYPYYESYTYNNTLDAGYDYFLYATPTNGYYFSGWSGDSNSSANPLSFKPTADFNITAHFTLNPIILSVGTSPANGGNVYHPYYASDPGGGSAYTFENSLGEYYSLWYSTNQYVPVNASVYVQAVPATGYSFSGWSGDANGTTNPIAVTATEDLNMTANFELLTFAVSTEVIGDGNVSGTGNYSYGSQANLTSYNSEASTFLGWDTNNTIDGNWSSANLGYYLDPTNPLSIQISKDVSYKAYFSDNIYPADNNLTAAIEEFLVNYPYALYFSGVPLKNNPSSLTQAHLEGITYFTAPDNGRVIRNLDGIQYAKNLQLLTIQKNGISDLSPIIGLGSLTSLDLSGGGTISTLEGLDQLLSIQYLYLDRHRISSISPLAKLPYLYYLKIKENFLDLSDPAIQYEISTLRQYATVEVEQQIPVPLQNLSTSMSLMKEKLKIDSTDPSTNFIFALELILNLIEDDSSSSLKALALSLGANHDILSFTIPDMWLEDVDYGNEINPTFNSTEIENYLKDTFIVTLEIADLYLDRIPATTSYITLTQDFTGLEQVLYADMGDVYLLKSIINGLIGLSQIILSYDWPMSALTAKQMHDTDMVNLESLFDSSSQFGSLKKKTLLSESRENIKDAITFYKSASEYLRYRIAEKRFFNLNNSDLTEEEQFRSDLDDIMISLDYRIDLNNSESQNDVLHLKNFFQGKVDLSDAMPSAVGNKFESSTVNDPTFGGVVPFWTAATLKQQLEQANLVASDAIEGVTEVENAPNWKQSNWLGYFYIPTRTDSNKFWMYHLRLGWVYFSSSSPANIWLYHQSSSSWLWTKKSSFPYLYNDSEKTWHYLLESGKMIKWEGKEWE